MIHIVTDSTADLSPEMIEDYHIGVIPLSVYMNGRLYRDKIDITLSDLFRAVDASGQLPKTSAPPIAEFLTHFELGSSQTSDNTRAPLTGQ